MTGLIGFLTAFFSFAGMLFSEYLKRSSAAAQAQKQYVVDMAEFQAMTSAVLTRLRLADAAQSQQAQKTETQVDDSLNERKNDP